MMRTRTLMMMTTTVVLALAACVTTAEAATYNVRSPTYGAVGNGTTDDTVAVQAALTAAVGAGGGEVYFPAGTYKLTAMVTVAGASVTLRGDGQRTSTLRWHGLSSGGIGLAFYYNSPDPDPYHNLTIRGLSFVRNDGSGGTAIWTYFPTGSTGPRYLAGGSVTALLEDFHIGAEGSAWWQTGLFVGGAIGAKIATFNIQGVAGGSEYGVRLTNVMGATVHDGNINGYKIGVNASYGTEGVNVQHLTIRYAETGVEFIDGAKGNAITSNQIWSYHWGVMLKNGGSDVAVVDNQIIRLAGLGYSGVLVQGDTSEVKRPRIIGNTIYSAPGGQSSVGIVLWNTVSDPVIQGNITQNLTYGTWLTASSVTNGIVTGNINRGALTPIINSGVNTYCANNSSTC
jgi:hypothetical protein